jgi:hypothetical protein
VADALKVNGTDLAALGRVVQDFGSGLGGGITVRNDADVVPRRRGSIGVDSVMGSCVVSVKMLLHGQASGGGYSRPQYHDNARALRALVVNRGRQLVLTRVIDAASGTLTQVANGRYLRGLESIEQVAWHAGRVAFDLELFDGCFYDSGVTSHAPGTFTVLGDLDTRRITLDLPGPGTLTNTTLGIAVTVADNCVLDVEAFTSTIPARLATMTFSGDDYWFALAAGSNTVTWSGAGTPTIFYKSAWL